jgi:hypothetical protein
MLVSASVEGAGKTLPKETDRKRFVRVPVVGLLFGFPLAIMTPASPFFKKSVKQNKNPQYLFMASFLTNTIGAMIGYSLGCEFGGRNPDTARLRPNLTYTNCVFPGLGALLFSHFCYPGVFVFLGERTWRKAGSEYRRLTWRCLLAFAPAHLSVVLPFSLLVAAVIGVKKKKPDTEGSVNTVV